LCYSPSPNHFLLLLTFSHFLLQLTFFFYSFFCYSLSSPNHLLLLHSLSPTHFLLHLTFFSFSFFMLLPLFSYSPFSLTHLLRLLIFFSCTILSYPLLSPFNFFFYSPCDQFFLLISLLFLFTFFSYYSPYTHFFLIHFFLYSSYIHFFILTLFSCSLSSQLIFLSFSLSFRTPFFATLLLLYRYLSYLPYIDLCISYSHFYALLYSILVLTTFLDLFYIGVPSPGHALEYMYI
jgi:hypothetical protein